MIQPRKTGTFAKMALGPIASIYLVLCAVMMYLETTLLFPAPTTEHVSWTCESYGATEAWVESNDGTKVHTWFWKHPEARATIVFSHGNGESLGCIGEEMNAIRKAWRVNVVAYDYRGYGKTPGKPTEKGILDDSVAVCRFVEADENWNQVPIVPFGRSLGGAAAIEMTRCCKTDGLILDRTFSSIADVGAYHFPIFPVRWLIRNPFYSINKISDYRGPLLQQHGITDRVIPYRFGKRLFDSCPSSDKELLTIQNLGHNDPWPREFSTKVDRFLGKLKRTH